MRLRPGATLPHRHISIKSEQVYLDEYFLERSGVVLGVLAPFTDASDSFVAKLKPQVAALCGVVDFIGVIVASEKDVAKAWIKQKGLDDRMTFFSDPEYRLAEMLGLGGRGKLPLGIGVVHIVPPAEIKWSQVGDEALSSFFDHLGLRPADPPPLADASPISSRDDCIRGCERRALLEMDSESTIVVSGKTYGHLIFQFSEQKQRNFFASHNGRELQIDCPSGLNALGQLYLKTKRYRHKLRHFHLHMPGLHFIESTQRAAPLEIHFVFENEDNSIAVIALLFSASPGAARIPLLEQILNSAVYPVKINTGSIFVPTGKGFCLEELFPDGMDFLQYEAPPPSKPRETTSWFISMTPIETNRHQLEHLCRYFVPEKSAMRSLDDLYRLAHAPVVRSSVADPDGPTADILKDVDFFRLMASAGLPRFQDYLKGVINGEVLAAEHGFEAIRCLKVYLERMKNQLSTIEQEIDAVSAIWDSGTTRNARVSKQKTFAAIWEEARESSTIVDDRVLRVIRLVKEKWASPSVPSCVSIQEPEKEVGGCKEDDTIRSHLSRSVSFGEAQDEVAPEWGAPSRKFDRFVRIRERRPTGNPSTAVQSLAQQQYEEDLLEEERRENENSPQNESSDPIGVKVALPDFGDVDSEEPKEQKRITWTGVDQVKEIYMDEETPANLKPIRQRIPTGAPGGLAAAALRAAQDAEDFSEEEEDEEEGEGEEQEEESDGTEEGPNTDSKKHVKIGSATKTLDDDDWDQRHEQRIKRIRKRIPTQAPPRMTTTDLN